MFRSLHMKLTLILLLLITSLMAVVGAFLTTSVTSFYIDSFYQQMSSAFGADRREFVADLRSAAAQPDGAERIQEIMEVNAGMLGIDYRTRNYYVLDGTAGSFLAGSAESSDLPREQSANLLTARNAVARKDASTVGDESDISADYMDVAIPIFGGDNAFIIYILDNKDTVSDLNNQLFQIIMQALIIGLLISVLLSFLLSKTMVGPIEKLTIGAERVAAGDFDSELPVESTDEIGILTGTFNEMAEVLQSTLAAVENERNKLDTLSFLPVQSLSAAVISFVGQNMGASREDRVRQGVRITVTMAVVWTVLSSALVVWLSVPLSRIFSPDPAVIAASARYLQCVMPPYVLFAILFVLNSAMRGAGDSLYPMVNVVASVILLRVPFLYLLANRFGPDAMYWSYGIGWAVACALSVYHYAAGKWRGKYHSE